jgi:hypothetical protein
MQHVPLIDATRFNMLLDDLDGSRFVDLAVPDAVRINDDEGAAPALIQAIHFRDHHAPAQVLLLKLALQGAGRSLAALAQTGFVLADEYVSADFLEL